MGEKLVEDVGMAKTGNSNPTTNYLLTGKGRGTSSVVKGSGQNFSGGVKQGAKDVGTKRFDVTSKSLNRGRKM